MSLLQKFACNGTVIEHPEYGEVIQLQGDQRKNICQFLVEVGPLWLLHAGINTSLLNVPTCGQRLDAQRHRPML